MVLAAALTAAAAFAAAAAATNAGRPRTPVWPAISLILLALAAVAILRLDEETARAFARYSFHHGWYDNRRPVQALVSAILVLAGFVVAWVVLRGASSLDRLERVAIGGALTLVCFMALRSVSYHNVDHFLGLDRDGPLTLATLLAATALLSICVPAVEVARAGSWRRKPRRRDALLALSLALPWLFAGFSFGVSTVPEKPLHDAGLVPGGMGADGILIAGASLAAQPQVIRPGLPANATVVRAFLYWAGEDTGAGDATADVNGTPLEGIRIAGPTYFYTWFDRVHESAFRADVTAALAAADGEVEVGGLTFDVATSGAALVVFYRSESGTGEMMQLREGLDLAFAGFNGPRHAAAPQTFAFPPSSSARVAQLTLGVSAVDADEDGAHRPSAIEIEVGGTVDVVLDPLGDNDDGWDLLTYAVDVPPNVSAVTVTVLSEDRSGAGRTPVSFALILAAFELTAR